MLIISALILKRIIILYQIVDLNSEKSIEAQPTQNKHN